MKSAYERNHTRLKRIVSLITLIPFLFSHIPEGFSEISFQALVAQNVQTDQSPATSFNLYIPAKIGNVIARSQGHSNRMIVQIEDAHCQWDAQSNIARILDMLSKEKGADLKTVHVEGSSGKLDTSAFASFPDGEARRKLARHYLYRGKMSGAEYFSILRKNSISLRGAENLRLYFKSLKSFDHALTLSKKADDFIADWQALYDKLSGRIFNGELKAFLKFRQDYEEGRRSLDEYLSGMEIIGGQKNVKSDDLFQLNLFLKARKAAEKIDFNVLENERSSLVSELIPLLSKEESVHLLAQNLYFRLEKIPAHVYFSALAELIREEELSKDSFKNVMAYARYLEMFEKIDKRGLMRDLETWSRRIKKSLLISGEERRWERFGERLIFLKNFYHMELKRKDFEAYRKNPQIFPKKLKRFVLNVPPRFQMTSPDFSTLDFLLEHLHELEFFYDLALQRDHALVERTLQHLEASGESVGVLIAGGFHTDGISEELKDKGISYVVVTPKTAGLKAKSPYLSVMEDERDGFENALKGGPMGGISFSEKEAQALNAMSLFQEEEALMALLKDTALTDHTAVSRKLESVQLFTLLYPALLEMLSAAGRSETNPLVKEWRKSFRKEISREARRKGILPPRHFVRVGEIEKIEGKFFIHLEMKSKPWGIVIDEKSAKSMKVGRFEKGLMNGKSFEKEKKKSQTDFLKRVLAGKYKKKDFSAALYQELMKAPERAAVLIDAGFDLLAFDNPTSIRYFKKRKFFERIRKIKELNLPAKPFFLGYSAASLEEKVELLRKENMTLTRDFLRMPPEKVRNILDLFVKADVAVERWQKSGQREDLIEAQQAYSALSAYKLKGGFGKKVQGKSLFFQKAGEAESDLEEAERMMGRHKKSGTGASLNRALGFLEKAGNSFSSHPNLARSYDRLLAQSFQTAEYWLNTVLKSNTLQNFENASGPLTIALEMFEFTSSLMAERKVDFVRAGENEYHDADTVRAYAALARTLLALKQTLTEKDLTSASRIFEEARQIISKTGISHAEAFLKMEVKEPSITVEVSEATMASSIPVIPLYQSPGLFSVDLANQLTTSLPPVETSLPGRSFKKAWIAGIAAVIFAISGFFMWMRERPSEVRNQPVIPSATPILQEAPVSAGISGTSQPVSTEVASPTVEAVTGFIQTPGANELRWNAVPGADAYRVMAAGTDGNWRLLGTVSSGERLSMRLTGSVRRARVYALRHHEGADISSPPAEITVLFHATRPRPRSNPRPEDNPFTYLRAPLHNRHARGKEKVVGHARLTGSNFILLEKYEDGKFLTDDTRQEYKNKIQKSLLLLSKFRNLDWVNVPVDIVEDLDTWMDFGHGKGLLRIDTDALSEENDSPFVLALLLHHELAHARGANELKAIQADMALYAEMKAGGFQIPVSLRNRHAYFVFLEKHHASSVSEQIRSIRIFLWQLALIRTAKGIFYGAGGFFRRIYSNFHARLKLLFDGAGNYLNLMRRGLRAVTFSLSLSLSALTGAFYFGMAALPSEAHAQTPDLNQRISEGYRFSITQPIPEGRIFGIRTCGAAGCAVSSGREDYFIHHGENHVWLLRSRGHRYMRIAMFEAAEEPRLIGSWTNSLPVTLTVPEAPAAPGHVVFDTTARRLTWDNVSGARGYEVSGYDASLTDDTSTLRDERWVSLGEISQDTHPGLEITRAGLSRVRVTAVIGGRGGEIRGTPSEITLTRYALAAPVAESSAGEEWGFLQRTPTNYIVNLSPRAGVSAYRVYTSDSREALEALRNYFETNQESFLTRARTLGFQEYESSNPSGIALNQSYGHDFMLIRTGSGEAEHLSFRSSRIIDIGSTTTTTFNGTARFSWGFSVTPPSRDRQAFQNLLWEHGPREVFLSYYLPRPIAPWGRPLRLETSFREYPYTSNEVRYSAQWATVSLGSYFPFANRERTITGFLDPQISVLRSPLATTGLGARLGYGLNLIGRVSPNDSLEVGLSGEGRFLYFWGLPWDFDTRSSTPVNGSPLYPVVMRWIDLYPRVTANPAVMYFHNFTPDARLGFGVRNEVEVANPVANTLLGVAQLEVPTFQLSVQAGNMWSLHFDERTSPIIRGSLVWTPAPAFQLTGATYYQFRDGETTTTLEPRVHISDNWDIFMEFYYWDARRQPLYDWGPFDFRTRLGLEWRLPSLIRERAPLKKSKIGEMKEIYEGTLSGGKFSFDSRREISGQDNRIEYTQRLQEALEWMRKYALTGDISLKARIVEDLDTWMDFGHETDEGPSSRFGEERGVLQIDTDIFQSGNASKEVLGILLNHEISHARGADEMGAILLDLAFFARMKEENPEFQFSADLKEKHAYFRFLENHYALEPEAQVRSVLGFLIENKFIQEGQVLLRMSEREAVSFAARLQALSAFRRGLKVVPEFMEDMRHEYLKKMMADELKALWEDDIWSDDKTLMTGIERILEMMADSDVRFHTVMEEVEALVSLRFREKEERGVEIDKGAKSMMFRKTALAFLLMAGLLGRKKIPTVFFDEKILDQLVQTYVKEKRDITSHMREMRLYDLLSVLPAETVSEKAPELPEGKTFHLLKPFLTAMALWQTGRAPEALGLFLRIRENVRNPAWQAYADQMGVRMIQIDKDGHLNAGGHEFLMPPSARKEWARLYHAFQGIRGREGPLYIDLTRAGELSAARIWSILELILKEPHLLEGRLARILDSSGEIMLELNVHEDMIQISEISPGDGDFSKARRSELFETRLRFTRALDSAA